MYNGDAGRRRVGAQPFWCLMAYHVRIVCARCSAIWRTTLRRGRARLVILEGHAPSWPSAPC